MPVQSLELKNQVVQFFGGLFDRLFTDRLLPEIRVELDRRRAGRQIEELADTASQSLSRFLSTKELSDKALRGILDGLRQLTEAYDFERLANPNETHEVVAAELLEHARIPAPVAAAGEENAYRLAFRAVTQAVMRVAPVLADWKRYNFSRTYEVPRQLNARLEQIAEQYETLGSGRIASVDERFELAYRDYLMQRLLSVEAGTVRMATNLNVDLKTLFVMPGVRLRRDVKEGAAKRTGKKGDDFLSLTDVKRAYAERSDETGGPEDDAKQDKNALSAWDAVTKTARVVLVGPPGAGKSTFSEWLQLQVAEAKEHVLMAGEGQAIPILLRVRQFDAEPPTDRAIIAKATASEDWGKEMPAGWIERQMAKGRILLMIDGLDETEPEVRDGKLLPWLTALCKKYPKCRYLVSSRPVGYPPGWLKRLKFREFDIEDFTPGQIAEYSRHWCTAVRLARNEPASEAEREGEKDGQNIVEQIRQHAYIRDLARNPLMLSAVCLVNAFEHGKLPDDRVILYRMCVEGLLHNWDQRRGIRSAFSLTEKLRACREVAIAMQREGRAEFPESRIREIFARALERRQDADTLLQHIRYRTGLLLERRPRVYAFAHLTFQEYLAAVAVDQGNEVGVTREQLLREHDDIRWREVLPLLCGLSSRDVIRDILGRLMSSPRSRELAAVLNDSYFACVREVGRDKPLRRQVLAAILQLPSGPSGRAVFRGFDEHELTVEANRLVGCAEGSTDLSNAFRWLQDHPGEVDSKALFARLHQWKRMNPFALCECVYLLHWCAPMESLAKWSSGRDCYRSPGPKFSDHEAYGTQGAIALMGIVGMQSHRLRAIDNHVAEVLLAILNSLTECKDTSFVGPVDSWPSVVAEAVDSGLLTNLKDGARACGSMLIANAKDGRCREFGQLMIRWADSLEVRPKSSKKRTRTASETPSKPQAKKRKQR